jgi:dCTP deaminase
MILTGQKIFSEWKAGRIQIDPFCSEQLNPNSYDFRLGTQIKIYKQYFLDPKKHNRTNTVEIPEKGYVLMPGRIYLGHTAETMGSDYFVPIIRAKSSIARLGLFVHVTADLIDIGSHNQWTLQLNPVQPMRIYPNMCIGQVTFWRVFGKITLYKGKYQGSKGPCESYAFKDMTL